jgi:hypothetical protein
MSTAVQAFKKITSRGSKKGLATPASQLPIRSQLGRPPTVNEIRAMPPGEERKAEAMLHLVKMIEANASGSWVYKTADTLGLDESDIEEAYQMATRVARPLKPVSPDERIGFEISPDEIRRRVAEAGGLYDDD